MNWEYARVVRLLRRPDARLVLEHTHHRNRVSGRDGLRLPWFGRTWLNPPFDRRGVGAWIRKLAMHGRGTTLLHARCETTWFTPVWESATAILFLATRLHFHRPDGTRQPANSGAPPILAAFGNDDADLGYSRRTGNRLDLAIREAAMTASCAYCRQPFEPRRPWALYCSGVCRIAGYRTRHPVMHLYASGAGLENAPAATPVDDGLG
jgi:hypothetical protein